MRVMIAATPDAITAKHGGDWGVNKSLPHPVALPGETQHRVVAAVYMCVCVFSSQPELHLWASTQQREAQQSDVSMGMKPACGKKMGNKGVEDGEWGGFGPYSGVTLLPCSSALPVT